MLNAWVLNPVKFLKNIPAINVTHGELVNLSLILPFFSNSKFDNIVLPLYLPLLPFSLKNVLLLLKGVNIFTNFLNATFVGE